MAEKKLTDDERRDATLRRMLQTPPKPFTPPQNRSPDPRRNKLNRGA